MDEFNPEFPAVGVAFFAVFGLFVLAMIALQVWVFWRIFSKAGHPGALSLLMLVPLVNVGMLIYLAVGEWPVLQELAVLRRRSGEQGTDYSSLQRP